MTSLGQFVGIMLAPFMLFLMVFLVASPIKRLLARKMGDCALKRLLFYTWKV